MGIGTSEIGVHIERLSSHLVHWGQCQDLVQRVKKGDFSVL